MADPIIHDSQDMPAGDQIVQRWFDITQDGRYLTWTEKANESYEFYFGRQWTSDERGKLTARGQADLVINRIRPIIRHALSIMTAQSPAFNVTTVTTDDAMKAWVLKEAITHVLRINHFPKEMERTLRDTLIAGRGALLVFYDKDLDDGRGDIGITHIRRDRLYIDYNAQHWAAQDARDMMISDVIYVEAAIDTWPKFKQEIRAVTDMYLDEPVSMNTNESDQDYDVDLGTDPESDVPNAIPKVRVFEYYRRVQAEVFLVTDPAGRELEFYDEEEALQQKDAMAEKGIQVKIEALETKRIQKITSVANVVVEEEILPTYYYPIILFQDEDTENPYSLGEVEFMKGKQQFINKAHSVIIQNAALNSNPKLLVKRGSIPADRKSNFQDNWAKPGSVNEVEDLADIQVIHGEPLNTAFTALVEQTKHEIEYDMGIFGFAQGDPSSAPETYRATLALREYGMEKVMLLLRSIDSSLSLLGQIVLRFIQMSWGPNKAVRITTPLDEEKMKEMKEKGMVGENGMIPINAEKAGIAMSVINDVSVGKYDVVPIPRSYLPSNTMQKLNMYMDLKDKGIVDGEAVLDYLDTEDKDRIKARLSQVEQQQHQLNAMSEELEKSEQEGEELKNKLFDADRRIRNLEHQMKLQREMTNLHAQGRLVTKDLSLAVKKTEIEENAKRMAAREAANKKKGGKKSDNRSAR